MNCARQSMRISMPRRGPADRVVTIVVRTLVRLFGPTAGHGLRARARQEGARVLLGCSHRYAIETASVFTAASSTRPSARFRLTGVCARSGRGDRFGVRRAAPAGAFARGAVAVSRACRRFRADRSRPVRVARGPVARKDWGSAGANVGRGRPRGGVDGPIALLERGGRERNRSPIDRRGARERLARLRAGHTRPIVRDVRGGGGHRGHDVRPSAPCKRVEAA